jgi:hypothetical protein
MKELSRGKIDMIGEGLHLNETKDILHKQRKKRGSRKSK